MAARFSSTTKASKTYATEANLHKAVAALPLSENVRYLAVRDGDGRWFAVFFGQQAVHEGAHFFGVTVA